MIACANENCKRGDNNTRKMFEPHKGKRKKLFCSNRCRLEEWMSRHVMLEKEEYERLKEIEKKWTEININ